MQQTGIIYFGYTGTPGLFKIGETGRPSKRFFDLRQAEQFTVIHTEPMQTAQGRKIAEAILRSLLEAFGCTIYGNDHFRMPECLNVPVVALMAEAVQKAEQIERWTARTAKSAVREANKD